MINHKSIIEHVVQLRRLEFVGEAGFNQFCSMFNVQDFGIYANENCPNCKGFYFLPESHPLFNLTLNQCGGVLGEKEAEKIAAELHQTIYTRSEFYFVNTLTCWFSACEILSTPPTYATAKQIIKALLKEGFRMRFAVLFSDASITDIIFLPPLGDTALLNVVS